MEEQKLYLRGERLYLKELTSEDISDAMMKWFEDAELMRYYTNSGKAIDKDSLTHAVVEGKKAGNNYTLGIFLLENNRMIGTVKIGLINTRHGISDLATLIGDRDYHGKGYSEEAIRLGTEIAFRQLDIRCLHTSMYWSNQASIRAYLKAGWIVEGRLKSYYLVDGMSEDRLLVGCYNPDCFSIEEIDEVKSREHLYYER